MRAASRRSSALLALAFCLAPRAAAAALIIKPLSIHRTAASPAARTADLVASAGLVPPVLAPLPGLVPAPGLSAPAEGVRAAELVPVPVPIDAELPAEPPLVARLKDRPPRSAGGLAKAIMEDHDVLILGENHDSHSALQLLIDLLPHLKEAGVTHIGLENMDHRGGFQTPSSRVELARRLFDGSRAAGIEIVGIDLPLATVERALARRPAEQVLLTTRNRFMAWRLDRAARGGKAVVLVGDGHTRLGRDRASRHPLLQRVTDALPDHLAERGWRPFSLSLVGGLMGPEYDGDLYREALKRAAPEPGQVSIESADAGVLNLGPIQVLGSRGTPAGPR